MALRISDYVYVLSKGEVVYESTPEELSKNEEIQGKYLAVEKADLGYFKRDNPNQGDL